MRGRSFTQLLKDAGGGPRLGESEQERKEEKLASIKGQKPRNYALRHCSAITTIQQNTGYQTSPETHRSPGRLVLSGKGEHNEKSIVPGACEKQIDLGVSFAGRQFQRKAKKRRTETGIENVSRKVLDRLHSNSFLGVG